MLTEKEKEILAKGSSSEVLKLALKHAHDFRWCDEAKRYGEKARGYSEEEIKEKEKLVGKQVVDRSKDKLLGMLSKVQGGK